MSTEPTDNVRVSLEEDHEYFEVGNNFLAEIAPYLNSPDKVPLQYFAFISDGTRKIKFGRTKLVAASALERAKVDSDFGYRFCHSIALRYKQEMFALDQFVCRECGGPARDMVQLPLDHLKDDPPRIHDFSVSPVCSVWGDCAIKVTNNNLNFWAETGKVANKWIAKTKTDVPHIAAADNPPRVCMQCGKVGNSMRRCSRCKTTFYCNIQCQRKSWPKHKKECVPAEQTSDDKET